MVSNLAKPHAVCRYSKTVRPLLADTGPPVEKLRILAEANEPGGACEKAVAAKHDVYPSLLLTGGGNLFGPRGSGNSNNGAAFGCALIENSYHALFMRTTEMVQRLQAGR